MCIRALYSWYLAVLARELEGERICCSRHRSCFAWVCNSIAGADSRDRALSFGSDAGLRAASTVYIMLGVWAPRSRAQGTKQPSSVDLVWPTQSPSNGKVVFQARQDGTPALKSYARWTLGLLMAPSGSVREAACAGLAGLCEEAAEIVEVFFNNKKWRNLNLSAAVLISRPSS